MDYIKIKFGRDFEQSEPKFENTLDDMFRSLKPLFAPSERRWQPQMDICETPEEIIIRGALSGVAKEQLGVEINSKAVRIYGQRREPPPMDNSTYRLAEIQYGKFERILFLPAKIDTDVISSSYTDGFLELRLAKVAREKTYKIQIHDE
jgi:HSP20 family protein